MRFRVLPIRPRTHRAAQPAICRFPQSGAQPRQLIARRFFDREQRQPRTLRTKLSSVDAAAAAQTGHSPSTRSVASIQSRRSRMELSIWPSVASLALRGSWATLRDRSNTSRSGSFSGMAWSGRTCDCQKTGGCVIVSGTLATRPVGRAKNRPVIRAQSKTGAAFARCGLPAFVPRSVWPQSPRAVSCPPPLASVSVECRSNTADSGCRVFGVGRGLVLGFSRPMRRPLSFATSDLKGPGTRNASWPLLLGHYAARRVPSIISAGPGQTPIRDSHAGG